MKISFIYWDWKEQPDISQFQSTIQAVTGGSSMPYLLEIEDSGWDQVTVAVSQKKLSLKEATKLFQDFLQKDLDSGKVMET